MATAPKIRYVWILLLPAIGGLLSGLVVWKFAPEARGHGTDAAIASFHRQGGHIRKRVPLVKFIATALSMGSGGSGGAEGPIGQIGAGFGSFIATRLHLGPKEKRWLMIAGLAAGVGAIFRVPLAGAIFAAEVLYSKAEIETEVLIPACVCSIVAYCVYGLRMGFGHMFPVSGATFGSPLELLTYLALALLVSGGALLFIWAFYGTEGVFRRLKLPFFLKPAIGGLLTGATAVVLILLVPDRRVADVLSTGYGVLQDALSGQAGSMAAGLLMAVALGKIATTSLTIGSGGSAGVFGPSMVIGGTMGGAAGIVLHSWLPALAPNPSTYAVVGMAGFFAAAANTPLAAVILVTEMTGGYDLIVPAVWVCSISFLVCRRWTIFRSQVPSRINSPAHIGEYAFEMMGGVRVDEVFKASRRFVPVPPETPAADVLKISSGTRQRVFPVTTADGRLLGTFRQAELLQAIQDNPGGARTAGDLMQPVSAVPFRPAFVKLSDPVSAAHRQMNMRDVDEVVVVSDDGCNRVIGILTAADVLLAYSRRLADLSRESGSDELLPPVMEQSDMDEQETENISGQAPGR
jgi:CIC family chloride channel protein